MRPLLPWLAGASDPYDAQDRLTSERATRPLEEVVRELASALAAPDLAPATREHAIGLVAGLVDDLDDVELLVSLVAHLGPSTAEAPEVALVALARGLLRAPDDSRLHEAIRAAARRARQPRYDARHGLDALERAVRAGDADRGVIPRFLELVERPDPPSPEAVLVARAAIADGDSEIDALIDELGAEALARALIAGIAEVASDAPEATRLAAVARALRPKVEAPGLRGRLSLAEAQLLSPDPQVAIPCAIRALAEDASLAKVALALVQAGASDAPDALDDDELRGVCARLGLDATVTNEVLASATKGRASGS